MIGLQLALLTVDDKLLRLEAAVDKPFDREASLRIDAYVDGGDWLAELLRSRLRTTLTQRRS